MSEHEQKATKKSDEKKREEVVNKVKKLFSQAKEESENEEKVENLDKEREKAIKFFKAKKDWIAYIVLAAIIYIGSFVRTRNLNLLKDVTTGNFIPLALDPHLFTKYAREIVETGTLAAIDMTRYVPEGIPTVKFAFMSYFIVWVHKILSIFNPNVTIEYAAIVYPVICFAVAMVFFFLLVRKLFDTKIALLSSLFLAIVPAFMQRTTMGFADHEALGVMLMFMAMYFYVIAWQHKKLKKSIAWGFLAGIFTGLMGQAWGGWKFLILIISLFTLVELFLDKITKKDTYMYFVWVLGFLPVVTLWIPIFGITDLVGSATTGVAFLVVFVLLVDLLIFKMNKFGLKKKITALTKNKIPVSVASLVISFGIMLVLALVVVGPGEITGHADEVTDNLLHPLGNDRWELTVAEQHQPYFTEWISQFGPHFLRTGGFGGFPLFLLFFMAGSVLMFFTMVKENKYKWRLTGAFTAFILAFSMSRYSSNSVTFNGVTGFSIFVYLGSLAAFMLYIAYFYLKAYNKDDGNYEQILSWDKRYIFVLIWFVIMVVAARGASRLFFIFAPITAITASYAVVYLGKMIWKIKNDSYKYLAILLLVFVLISPFAGAFKGLVPAFYEGSLGQGTYSGPGYSQQWQVTGDWVRNNIPEDAVFGHWWDYGYWVQNGWERSTVLDGTNRIKYWNFLMGRHVLTGQSQEEALKVLKAHDTSHYLIVADEIGKYTAYSSIGADENYDRYSWISTFVLNEQGTRETRDTTVLAYEGSYVFDDDFVWEGTVYPRQQSGIGAIFIPYKETEQHIGEEIVTTVQFEQPTAAVVHRGQRVDIPIECVYFNEQMFWFEEEGLGGCVRLMPTLNGDGSMAHPLGAGMYVSEEGVNALWTNLYVFNQANPKYDTSAFELVYGTPETFAPISLYQGRVIGPQKIWQINYPEGFSITPEEEALYLGGNELLPDYFYDVN